jgi:hypothetical protein
MTNGDAWLKSEEKRQYYMEGLGEQGSHIDAVQFLLFYRTAMN